MTDKQSALICTSLAGYEVQVSPADKYFIVTDDGVLEMPDFSESWEEAMSTLIAVCRSRGSSFEVSSWENGYTVYVYREHDTVKANNSVCLSAVAHCLLQIAEGE